MAYLFGVIEVLTGPVVDGRSGVRSAAEVGYTKPSALPCIGGAGVRLGLGVLGFVARVRWRNPSGLAMVPRQVFAPQVQAQRE